MKEINENYRVCDFLTRNGLKARFFVPSLFIFKTLKAT